MRKLLFTLALLLMGGVAFSASTPAPAAPAMPQTAVVDLAKGGVQPIHWHHHHHRHWGGYWGPYWGGYYGYRPRHCFWRWSERRQRMIRVCYRRW